MDEYVVKIFLDGPKKVLSLFLFLCKSDFKTFFIQMVAKLKYFWTDAPKNASMTKQLERRKKNLLKF